MIYEALLTYDNDVVIKGNRCILTPQELYQVLLYKDTTEIHISREFAEAFFTPSGLSDLVQNVSMVNPFCAVIIDADIRDFRMKAIKALSSYTSIEEIIYQLQAHPREMLDVIKMLCGNYTDTYSETLVANNKVAALHLQNSELIKKLEDLQEDYQRLLRDKTLTESKLGMLVGRINHSYEKDIDPSQFLSIEGKSRYTRILYIKERTRVSHIDTLIYYLKEILKTLYSVPAREVIIGPYYAYGGAKLYKGAQPSFDLSYAQLYKSDIYMPGFQPSVMADILKNPSNVEYLIVLDRCGFEAPHIIGEDVEYIYTMSDLADNFDDIDLRRIISYSRGTQFIPYIADFDKLSVEDKMVRYSSMRIMKFLIQLLERR
jgi:hypothetical protein